MILFDPYLLKPLSSPVALYCCGNLHRHAKHPVRPVPYERTVAKQPRSDRRAVGTCLGGSELKVFVDLLSE